MSVGGGKKRVCLIGAGPAGMSFLFHQEKLRQSGVEVPEVVCYEKQNNWGGLWNYTWRTGLDQYGEYVHGSMYRYLWSNGPKEASLEFPDYTFKQHFGKNIPSFPPREVLFDYIQGRWNTLDLRRLVRFEQLVQSVKYNADTNNFSVVVKDLNGDVSHPAETFDYVVNASGHFSIPNMPEFDGINRFPGRVLHSHDFRDALEFKDQTVLLIGSSYSAEDLALQCSKYGAKEVVCSYRTHAMGFKFPANVSERPLLTKLVGSTAHFKDGSTKDFDAIIMCTGYLHYYPYMAEDIRMKGPNVLYPDNLYKGTMWMKGGNNKVYYLGIQDQYYTWTMFDAQALWALKSIMGEFKTPPREEMLKEIKEWVQRDKAVSNSIEAIDFQSAFVNDLVKCSGYGTDLDIGTLFHTWSQDKKDNILTYRDKSFASKFTGEKSPVHHSTFMEALDDSLQCYLAVKE